MAYIPNVCKNEVPTTETHKIRKLKIKHVIKQNFLMQSFSSIMQTEGQNFQIFKEKTILEKWSVFDNIIKVLF